jgi:hypothetical protein
MLTPLTFCRAGTWTRIYQWAAPSGIVHIMTHGPTVAAHYKEWSAAPPFYSENNIQIGPFTPLWISPTPYLDLWINPSSDVTVSVT